MCAFVTDARVPLQAERPRFMGWGKGTDPFLHKLAGWLIRDIWSNRPCILEMHVCGLWQKTSPAVAVNRGCCSCEARSRAAGLMVQPEGIQGGVGQDTGPRQ